MYPEKGSAPALGDLPAGDVKQMFDLQATALPHLNVGKFETLAITSKTHNPQLPQVPAMSDGSDQSVKWGGVVKAASMVARSLLSEDHFTRAYPTPLSRKRS